MKRGNPLIILFLLILSLSLSISSIDAREPNSSILVTKIDGAITPATAENIDEAIKAGDRLNVQAIVILLNTPGGQLDATFKIIDFIEASEIPVISFVYPSGAKAWSAGTFILLSSHVAVMASHTIIGSAQPVSYSPIEGSKPIEDAKIVNALSAFIVERARMHGRNVTCARLFVEKNLNLNNDDALRFKVIDIEASNLDVLFEKLDGTKVKTIYGESSLTSKGTSYIEHAPSLKVTFLAFISDPILAFLLFSIGLYAIIFGLASPGYGAEVVGIIAIIIGLIGLGFSINFASILLIGLGMLLMIAEAYSPGFGLFGGAGLLCLIIGSLFIIPIEGAKWLISLEWYNYFMSIILGIASILGAFTLFMVYKILQARRRKPVIGKLIGEVVEVIDKINSNNVGYVRYKGEYWKAKSEERLEPGMKAIIKNKEGSILVVESKKDLD
ncbi:MAG: nodulation protein NfeD [Candidatus Bathyarchaeota archaeon]|nr:nodulation protein NfeD [Candidatus Bathyarchaeota archaeon]